MPEFSKQFFPADIDMTNAFTPTKRNRPMKPLSKSGKPDEKSAKSNNTIVNPGNMELGSQADVDLLGDTTRKFSPPDPGVDIDFDKMTGSQKG